MTTEPFFHIFIAIMGMTGAGKSTFVRRMTGQDVRVGHTLHAETQGVDSFHFQLGRYIIHLVDTPGFDDTLRTDAETLNEVATWLAMTYRANIRLTGILYLHRISDNRMGNRAILNLKMFRKMCGVQNLANVILMTTFWEPTTGNAEARRLQESREQQLLTEDQFWGGMIRLGAQSRRYDGTRERGLEIINELLQRPQFVLDIQRQIVDEQRQLHETDAGRSLQEEFAAAEARFAEQLRQLSEEREEAMRANDQRWAAELERNRVDLREQMDRINRDRQAIQEDMQTKLAQYEGLITKMSEDAGKQRVITLVSGIAVGVLTAGLGLFAGAAISGGALAGAPAAALAGELGRRAAILATNGAVSLGTAALRSLGPGGAVAAVRALAR